MTKNFETAYKGWNTAWLTEKGREDWSKPDPFITKNIQILKSFNCKKILDLGCGIGRHTLFLAQQGFSLTALDGSKSGLYHLKIEANKRKLHIKTVCQTFDSMPFSKNSFDCVIAFNVIYHGDNKTIQKSLLEIRRVLKSGGIFFATFLSKKNSDFGLGEQVAKDTFLRTHGYDKGHPHYYTNANDLTALLSGYEILSLTDQEHDRPNSFHWHLIAEKTK